MKGTKQVWKKLKPSCKRSKLSKSKTRTPKIKASKLSIGTRKKGRSGKIYKVVQKNGKNVWAQCKKSCQNNKRVFQRRNALTPEPSTEENLITL